MSWRDAKDTMEDPHASASVRRLAGDLCDMWNRIQKLEGETAQLRKDLKAHVEIKPPTLLIGYGLNHAASSCSCEPGCGGWKCSRCGGIGTIRKRRQGQMVTWEWKCTGCGLSSDGTD